MLGNVFAPLAMKVAAAIGLALALACAVLWWRLDATAGKLRDVRAERDLAITALTAERRANEADAKRQAEREARSNQSREAMRHAEDQNPDAARAAAGPVSRAAAERLRR
jgi:hypothetical protein